MKLSDIISAIAILISISSMLIIGGIMKKRIFWLIPISASGSLILGEVLSLEFAPAIGLIAISIIIASSIVIAINLMWD